MWQLPRRVSWQHVNASNAGRMELEPALDHRRAAAAQIEP